MSAHQRILTGLKKIKKIEGPIDITLLEPTSKLDLELGRIAPMMLLLGDMHSGQGKCSPCDEADGCYSLYGDSFIRYLDEFIGTDIRTDLYMELWLEKYKRDTMISKNLKAPPHTSALILTELRYLSCISTSGRVNRKKSCDLKNIKIHMTDIRRIKFNDDEEKYTGDKLVHTFILYFMDNKIDQFITYCRDMYDKYSITHIMDILKRHLTTDVNPFWTDPFYETYSKVHRQFRSIPNIKKTLFDMFSQHKGYALPIIRKSVDWEIKVFNTVDQLTIICDDATKATLIELMKEDTLVKAVSDGDSASVELYTLGRILKMPINQDPTQFAIIYEGANHTDNIIDGLIKTGYYKQISTAHHKQDVRTVYQEMFDQINREHPNLSSIERNKLVEELATKNIIKCNLFSVDTY